MSTIKNFVKCLTCFILFSCNGDNKIVKLLTSKVKDDIIEGARKAGNAGKKKFIPFLLKNADDERMSTNFDFKGVTVYQAKMKALRDIFKKRPPKAITYKLDSSIIKFYTELANLENLNSNPK